MTLTAQHWIDTLQLQAHPEGGWFRRTYTNKHFGGEPARHWMSAIYYLLGDGQRTGHLHRNRSDILHFWQGGHALEYTWVTPDGTLHRQRLGPDPTAGDCLQLLIPGDCWKASHLPDGDYGLISEAVCPGFDYADHEMATADTLRRQWPKLFPVLEPLIRPA